MDEDDEKEEESAVQTDDNLHKDGKTTGPVTAETARKIATGDNYFVVDAQITYLGFEVRALQA